VVVSVPPIPEQKEIAAFLDSTIAGYDDLTGQIEKGIEKLKTLRSSLITAAVTGQIDVRNYQPEAPCQ
jgi:type I restriction enzyme S subunit